MSPKHVPFPNTQKTGTVHPIFSTKQTYLPSRAPTHDCPMSSRPHDGILRLRATHTEIGPPTRSWSEFVPPTARKRRHSCPSINPQHIATLVTTKHTDPNHKHKTNERRESVEIRFTEWDPHTVCVWVFSVPASGWLWCLEDMMVVVWVCQSPMVATMTFCLEMPWRTSDGVMIGVETLC